MDRAAREKYPKPKEIQKQEILAVVVSILYYVSSIRLLDLYEYSSSTCFYHYI